MQAEGCITGYPVSLHILDYGLFRVHANGRVIGICGYLITTSAQERLLVDTGFPAKYATDPQAASLEDGLDAFGEVLHCAAENLPAAQLARAGVAPSEITHHIVTHSHIDHIGGLHDFPQAPLIVSAVERALPRPLYWAACQPITWPARTTALIEADTALGPDLDVLLVPGHAPGQLAIALRLPETGPVMLTSDAISRPAEIDEAFAGSWDAEQALHHALRITDRAKSTNAKVIYGHCPDQWATLKKAPHAYT